MSTVKENSLNEEMAQTAIMFLRLVTSKLTGDSKLIQIQNLILQIANVYGLQAALDSKIGIVTGESLEIPIFKTDGTLETSGLRASTFTTQLELDACTQSGFYTHTGTTLVMDMVGSILFAQVGNHYRLLFGTNGLWLQTYTAGWSTPRYVGGAFDNITIPYADAVDLASNSQLSPGASYKITGVGQDEGIILRAASADTFETDGIRLGLVPAHFEAGTFDSVTWLGVWRDTLTPSIGDVVVFMGSVWENNTGVVGNVVNDWFLDADNWTVIDPLIGVNEGFYVREVFGCTYRLVSNRPLVFTTGYVSRQWDSRGNSFGIEVEPSDGFKVEYNDFGNEFIYGNVLKSCRNNIAETGTEIYNNNGNGDIHDNEALIFENNLTDENNNIRFNNGGNIVKNTILGDADIDSNNGCSVGYSTICGDIKDNASGDIQYTEVGFNGKIKDCSDFTCYDSFVYGIFEGNEGVSLSNSTIHKTCEYKNKTSPLLTSIINSELISPNTSTESISGDIFVKEGTNKIIAEYIIETGDFDLANGSSFSSPYNLDGCNKSDIRSNGIIISGTNISNATFTCKYPGWYKIMAIASAYASSKCNFETICYVNSTAKQNVYNEKNYTTTGDYVNSVCGGNILLAKGDVVTFKFKHSYASPVTITLGQITITLEYNN